MHLRKPVIIAVVGLIGSGKTDATNRFVERGFTRVGFNDRVYEELSRRGMEANEPNERAVREAMRREGGMAVMAARSLPMIDAALAEGKDVVIESLYSWSEYKLLKERFGDQFRVLAIYAPPDIRYRRLAARPIRPLENEMAKSRDYAEVENIEKAGPIAMADWTIANIGTKDDFLRQLDLLIDEIVPTAPAAALRRNGVVTLPRPLTLVFLGRSGSGKGTQAEMLLKHLGESDACYIVTGNLFRGLAAKDTVIGRKVAHQLKVGELPPDWLANTLWQHELVERLVQDDQMIVFDGALRHVPEAIALEAVLAWLGRPKAIPILIDVTREEAFKRLKLRQRADDKDEAINRRLDWYDEDVSQVVAYYEKLGRLVRVDGMPAPDQVFRNLLEALGIEQKHTSASQ